MQAVILAAGKGERMGYLTADRPKPMLKVGDKTLLEYKFDILPSEITEIILIVGYKAEVIKSHFGESYNGLPITYIEQTERSGSGHALWLAKDILKDRFIVMTGDDLYSAESIKEALHFPLAMTVKKSASFKNAGDVIQTEDGYLYDIEFDPEGTREYILQDVCLYCLTTEIFNYDLVKAHNKDEWGLPHTLAAISKKLPIKVLETTFWIKINQPDDLTFAEKILLQK